MTGLRALNEAATSPPWEQDPAYPENIGYPGNNPEGEWDELVCQAEDLEDAALIVALRNAAPAIVALLEAAERVLEANARIRAYTLEPPAPGLDDLREAVAAARKAGL